jgi:hypothetical protein
MHQNISDYLDENKVNYINLYRRSRLYINHFQSIDNLLVINIHG